MQTFDPIEILSARFREGIARAYEQVGTDADALISASRQPHFGDFQSNAAMPLAKRVGENPRDVARKIISQIDVSDIAEPLTEQSIAGPGFINVRLKPEALARLLDGLDNAEVGLPATDEPMTVVVDLCGVNLAKQMHVGHLRATIIGDTIARLYERLGHRVVRQSHVGDWGLPIAMVTAKLLELDARGALPARLDLDDLNRWYKQAQAECAGEERALAFVRHFGGNAKIEAELGEIDAEADEHLSHARRVLVALQSGDATVRAMWQRIYDVTMSECLRACARLHTLITDEHSAGESTYADELAGVVQDLAARGVAEESDGALVVRVDGIEEPCLVRKSDGGFLYATTDMAAIRRRVQQIGADLVVYCVDARQSLHFKQVFGAATKAGYATRVGAKGPAHLEHAAFGTILGEDGRPFKTRSGESVKLSDLLDEAVTRAQAQVEQRSVELSDAERKSIAEAVGIAAIKYADLSNDRVKDYVFNFDRMLAFEGNTGPYLLYALVRIRSLFRKADAEGMAFNPGASIAIEQAEEKALALELLRYPKTVHSAAEAFEPHRLCGYLYELCAAYSTFYDRCHVLKAESERVRASRMRLVALTGRVLADGLKTLGLPTVERM
ncbi:MAG: arginine--tRNA ligase [Leptolyngbya sp. PLA3]|nr:MAG: arginine--tRNA ligase [Cyanobacteria bacterium CYA]MCE7969395.1 arginine--tRNA ligase [Leptolyngbya sp. PL-A3]